MIYRNILVLFSILLLAACAGPAENVKTSAKPITYPDTPMGRRELQLHKFREANIVNAIYAGALVKHTHVEYAKAAMHALEKHYSLDLHSQFVGLQEQNASAKFYQALGIAYKKRMKVPAGEINATAIKAMLKVVGPSARYYSAVAFRQFKHEINEKGRIGIRLAKDRHGIYVAGLKPNSVAARTDIPVHGYIVSIDKTAIGTQSLDEVSRLLRGRPGSYVAIGIERPGYKSKVYRLQRHVTNGHSIEMRLLRHHILYVRIDEFTPGTDKEIVDSYRHLEYRPRAIILDLRHNTGGDLNAVVKTANEFLPKGSFVEIKHRVPYLNIYYKTSPGGIFLNIKPVVVLVSSATASGAEALALALRFNLSAFIIGSKTSGSALIQSFIALPDGAAIKLAVARLVTSNGMSWQGKGIQPDICINFSKNRRIKSPYGHCGRSYYLRQLAIGKDAAIRQAMKYIANDRRRD